MATKLTNLQPVSIPLPYPYRGMLAPGESCTLSVAPATFLANVGRLSPGNGLRVEEIPDAQLPSSGADVFRSGQGAPAVVHAANGTLVPNALNILTGAVTAMTLPAASTWAGQCVMVKKRNVAADVVVSRSDADTIDGATSYTVAGAYATASFVADASAAAVIDAFPAA